MPKEKTVAVSKETLEALKTYQKEFNIKSLEEAIKDSLRWSKLWIAIDFQQRRSLQERVNGLEFRVLALEKSQK